MEDKYKTPQPGDYLPNSEHLEAAQRQADIVRAKFKNEKLSAKKRKLFNDMENVTTRMAEEGIPYVLWADYGTIKDGHGWMFSWEWFIKKKEFEKIRAKMEKEENGIMKYGLPISKKHHEIHFSAFMGMIEHFARVLTEKSYHKISFEGDDFKLTYNYTTKEWSEEDIGFN